MNLVYLVSQWVKTKASDTSSTVRFVPIPVAMLKFSSSRGEEKLELALHLLAKRHFRRSRLAKTSALSEKAGFLLLSMLEFTTFSSTFNFTDNTSKLLESATSRAVNEN